MKASAIICDDHQHFTLEDVTLPDVGPEQILVRTLYSGISIGTEFALYRNKLSWGPYPLCGGYMAVGVVEAVGARVTEYRVGEQVYFRRTPSIKLASGAAVSSVSGTHCSHAVLGPDELPGTDHLPAGVAPDVGSFFVVAAVGLYGVDMVGPHLGETVLVNGVGLVGLADVAWLRLRGCVVIAVDLNAQRLAVASKLGADHVIDASKQDVAAEVRKLVPNGADVVFESTGIPACIDATIPFCRTFGKFVWEGNYGSAPLTLHFLPPHGRRLQMFFPCDDGQRPCRQAVMKCLAKGSLQWQHVITHHVRPAEAPALFDRINRNQAPDVIGATVQW